MKKKAHSKKKRKLLKNNIIKIKPRIKKRAAEKGVLLKKRKSVKKNAIKRSVKKSVKKKTKKQAKKRKPASPVILVRSEQNPIISPKEENGWESLQTFNPGVALSDGKIHFLYRAIGHDGISRLGYAVSNDGLTVDERLSYPVYEHKIKERIFNIYSYFSGGSWGGAEDPRPVSVDGEDVLYMTYTACDNGLRVGLTSIKINDFLNKKWEWKPPVLISPPGEIHKNWVIFPEKINGKYAILLSIIPEIEISYFDNLDFNGTHFIHSSRDFGLIKNSGKGCWDKWLRGAGAPPIKTRDGWLLFYHAMDDDWSKYKVGAMLLDIKDPTKILHRSKTPVLMPEESYENNGCKSGVVYVSGVVVKDDILFVYYGGADTFVCAATAPLNGFLDDIAKNKELRLKKSGSMTRKNV